MIDASVRLRRAIHLNDLVLLKRIIKNNPSSLRNPDFTDKGNTSLHLAAKLGLLEIAEFLIESGHEDNGISRNSNRDTPLMLAAQSNDDVAQLIAERFPHCIEWKNKQGADALMLASLHGANPLVQHLLTHSPDLTASDDDGNTALHYASANGHLKCIRTLVQAGANPYARNKRFWTPINYSSTVQAEVYFKQLVSEMEKRKAEETEARRGREKGVRLVGKEGEEGDIGGMGTRMGGRA